MTDIIDVAISCWRLEKWINNIQVQRKISAINSVERIREYLTENGINIIDLTGKAYDESFPVVVVNAEEIRDNSIIIEMTKPIILKNGVGYSDGEVIVGTEIQEPSICKNMEINTTE